MTALAGAIPVEISKLSSNIEVVRLIPGVSGPAVDALAIGAELGGQQIRVLDPVSLLYCKVNLALTVPQTNRQDVGPDGHQKCLSKLHQRRHQPHKNQQIR